METIPRQLAMGVGECEGPVIRGDGEIVFVSFNQGRLYKIRDGRTDVLAEVGNKPNGATEWSDGTIYVAQAGGDPKRTTTQVGGIQAVDRTGDVRWLTRDPISPNDLCFGPDGLLYCTDPTRGRVGRDDSRLFRCDIKTGESELLCSIPWYANGIGFGPDDALYVARCNVDRPEIVRFSLDGGKLGKGETFIRLQYGSPDGFLFDANGNITLGAIMWTTEHRGQIQTYDSSGKLIDAIHPGPQRNYTNVALGPDRVLIITDTSGGAVLAIDNWPYAGLPLHPFRKHT